MTYVRLSFATDSRTIFLGIGHRALNIGHWALIIPRVPVSPHLPISPSLHHLLAAALYWGFFAAIFSLM
ncbi:hypothetical protein NSTC745_01848 [Nostoc sp. DSM 114161]